MKIVSWMAKFDGWGGEDSDIYFEICRTSEEVLQKLKELAAIKGFEKPFNINIWDHSRSI